METALAGSHLLVAAGRKGSVEGLGLDAAGVAHSSKGIQVDTRLRSSNRRIYAIGDVAVVDGLGGFQFTHLAGYHAGIDVRNALFKLPARVDYRALPRVRSEEHTSELQSLMRTSYAVFCLKETATTKIYTYCHMLSLLDRLPVLGLDAEGVAHSAKGVQVDTRLLSSNRLIYAIGDVAVVDGLGGFQFTHLAGYHAGIVVRNALFKLPARVDYRALPRVTFTDPEIAHVGLTETEARERHGDQVRALTWAFAANDRAQAERATEGLVKLVAGDGGRVLGASLAGHQ